MSLQQITRQAARADSVWGTARHAVELHGHGQVGKALVRRLGDAGIPLSSINTRRGSTRNFPAQGSPVLVDATAPCYEGVEAEAWVAFLERNLLRGTPVVTCNKAPLAVAWERLQRAARNGRSTIRYSATVGAGTPILPLLTRLATTQRIERIEATLSGTLAFVIARIAAGQPLQDAVLAAQEAGYAEPDPRLDLDGTDARAKATILHNTLFGRAPALRLASDAQPLCLDEEAILQIARAGGTPAAVATIAPGDVTLQVRDWIANGDGVNIRVKAHLESGTVVELSGPGAGPDATAGALLADLLELGADS